MPVAWILLGMTIKIAGLSSIKSKILSKRNHHDLPFGVTKRLAPPYYLPMYLDLQIQWSIDFNRITLHEPITTYWPFGCFGACSFNERLHPFESANELLSFKPIYNGWPCPCKPVNSKPKCGSSRRIFCTSADQKNPL